MTTEFKDVEQQFAANAAAVSRLLDFGNVIIEAAVGGLKEVETILENRNLHSLVTVVRNRAAMLSNVREESLRPQYQAMFNQCVVLLVSYFGSALHALFRKGVTSALESGADVPVCSHELKVSWRGVVRADESPATIFADLLIAQQDISFQDMQSIRRAFNKHLGIDLTRTSDTDNIILGQAARNAIVHAGGIADAKFRQQVSGATTRTLMPTVQPEVPIQFEPHEVRTLATSMDCYLRSAVMYVDAAHRQWASDGRAGNTDLDRPQD